MKNVNFLIKLVLLFLLTGTTCKCFAQTFYGDFIQYRDSLGKPSMQLTKSRIHHNNIQFASEFKKLFNEVKRKTGICMLDCDTLYVFESVTNHYSGGYSKLFWNNHHSCYYENPHFSAVRNEGKDTIQMQTDAHEKLAFLGPILKTAIQRADTALFLKHLRSINSTPLGDVFRFMVATKVGKHWHFFSTPSYAFFLPE